MIRNIKKYTQLQHIRFIIGGAFNSLFGYWIGVIVFLAFENSIPLWAIGVFTGAICISFTYAIHRYYVFRSNGNIFGEYFKAIFVYGLCTILSIVILYMGIKMLEINIYIVQLISTIMTAIVAFLLHKGFTFKS